MGFGKKTIKNKCNYFFLINYWNKPNIKNTKNNTLDKYMYMFCLKKMISKFSKNISNVKLHDMHDFCGFVQISLVWK